MIINAKQILHPSRKDENFWLYEEIMSSLTPEIIDSARNEDESLRYDVKLQINGFLVEPTLLPKIISGIEKIIDDEAEKIANEKLVDAMREVDVLHEVIKEAEYKIREKFNIKREED
jgi:hypothetical protein